MQCFKRERESEALGLDVVYIAASKQEKLRPLGNIQKIQRIHDLSG